MKKCEVLKVVFLLLGTVIGAGFASGKEVFLFFGAFSFESVVSIILCSVVFFLVCLMFLNCKTQCNYFYLQKSRIGITFDCVMLFFMLISISALSACLTSSVGIFLSIFSLIVAILSVILGINWLKNINFVLVPTIIIVLFIISFSSFNSSSILLNSSSKMITNSFLYVGMNIFLASELLCDVGRVLSRKQKIWAALLASIIFGVILIVLCLAFSFAGISDFDEMPIFKMTLNLSPLFSKIYLFILWAGVFTTLLSVIYSIKIKVKKVFNWGNWWVIILCIFAFAFSFFGFNEIVNIFYPLEGLVGLVYSIIIFLLLFACEAKHKPFKQKND